VCHCWNVIEADFENEAKIVGERLLIYFASRCPFSFCHDSEVLCDKSLHGADQPSSLLTWFSDSQHFYVSYNKNHPSRRNNSVHKGQEEYSN
jgi:hypothetical protein